ncbi:pantoate--beta-alanine ligase [Alcanivorax sp. 1008]|uniref:pantoate--beta-alanine ligase n=1 Tax=Alcanivorax sp. 1008 TaxID=2816853 RepID=UPI001DF29FE3|nr:pantoate--beta-alanine ligase [Alcanivorax sp. 1008]MCC1497892.1 pantoate--beta-alanine ligase [Alcanivorax sp. 1008]
MKTVHNIVELRQQIHDWRQGGLKIGFVPTMGNLHAGHISLIDEARRHADKVVASIFVNPTQFGPSEDFDSYPRTLEADSEKLGMAHCDLLFAPPVEEMYPEKNRTWVDVDELGDHLCGASRPGHFRGVSTVVSKLLNIVQPDIACFGEKDFQQLAVIRRMVQDLFFPVEIIGVATAREANGLALSSRNGYLSAEQKDRAAAIYATLQDLKARIQGGERDFPALVKLGTDKLRQAGFDVDYLNISNADTLIPVSSPDSHLVIAVAAKLGGTRLIDNVTLSIACDQ